VRRQHRSNLPLSLRVELQRLSRQASTYAAAREEWKRFLQRNAGTALKNELVDMARQRNRCAYCDDSRAADVDHFWPMSPYFDRTFVWANHVWACPECNRRKSVRFELVDGRPLVINPVDEDWWLHLVLDSATGIMVPRTLPDDSLDPRGVETIKVFRALTFESVIEGRLRSIRRLRDAVEAPIFGDDARSRYRGVASFVFVRRPNSRLSRGIQVQRVRHHGAACRQLSRPLDDRRSDESIRASTLRRCRRGKW
jgi:hypothetical protein